MNLKKDVFHGDKTGIGSWITLAHPAVAEIMAKSGFDWLAVDLEHSVVTIREAEELIRIIDLCGVTPLVRLTSNNADLIKRVMDAGSHGVIVPMINSVEEAQAAVAAVKYPPHGKRGVGLARAQGYGTSFTAYRDWLQESAVVVVQIEHIDAVRNFREIMAVDGVDGFIVGPYDLTSSMGIPGQFDHPDFVEVMQQIQQDAKDIGAVGGVHVIEPKPEELQQRLGDGYRFVAYSLDIRMLDASCREALKQI